MWVVRMKRNETTLSEVGQANERILSELLNFTCGVLLNWARFCLRQHHRYPIFRGAASDNVTVRRPRCSFQCNRRLVGSEVFEITGVSPRQTVTGFLVEETLGNGDGRVQAGEIIQLNLALEVSRKEWWDHFKPSLRALGDAARTLDGPGMLFRLSERFAQTVRTPRFVIPAEDPDEIISFEFGVSTGFATWRDTISIRVEQGDDQTPPAVGNLRLSSVNDSVQFEIPHDQIIEGGAVGSIIAEIFDADSAFVTSISLDRTGDGFEGRWDPPRPGLFLVRGVVSDHAGNKGYSRYFNHRVLDHLPEPDNSTGSWTPLILQETRYPLDYIELTFAPSNPQLIYLLTERAYWRSSDEGSSWSRLGRMNDGSRLLVDAIDPLTGVGTVPTDVASRPGIRRGRDPRLQATRHHDLVRRAGYRNRRSPDAGRCCMAREERILPVWHSPSLHNLR